MAMADLQELLTKLRDSERSGKWGDGLHEERIVTQIQILHELQALGHMQIGGEPLSIHEMLNERTALLEQMRRSAS